MRLSVDPRDGVVRLTLPPRAGLGAALDWVEERRPWVERALAGLPRAAPIVPGSIIPLEGGAWRLDWDAKRPRRIERLDDHLRAGGPIEGLDRRVVRWLRAQALATLDAETREIGARAGVSIGRVAVADQRSRWGSCTASGDIRYNWRLILAPPDVRRATVAHEVAHRLHMDHSPAFHTAVKALFGRDPRAERRWLATHGSSLYWFGRDC